MPAHELMPLFAVTSHDEGGRRVVRLAGELDLASEASARAALASALDDAGDELIVDLRGLTFLDVRGAHLLLALPERCRERGRRLQLIPGPASALRVLDLCGLRARLPFATLGEHEHSPLAA